MAELRKDYILDRYVIVSASRGKRPHEFRQEEIKEESKKDFFAPGNEDLTPPEIGRIETPEGWKMRWFPNKFAAVTPEGDPELRTDNRYFTYSSAYGHHEVIVETPGDEQLWDLPEKDIKKLLEVYADRIKELSEKDSIKYVSVFKNHGKAGGTSLIHSHSQVIAYNKIPEQVKEKTDAVKKHEACPYCEIIGIEKSSFRRCYENKSFAAFTPYASRFHFEIWVFPLKHIRSMDEMDEAMMKDLAEILKKIFSKLKELNAPYNMEIFYSPESEDMHFHIEISPRLAIFAGFEILTGDVINSLSPEEAAKFYREED